MVQQIPVDASAIAPEHYEQGIHAVADDIGYQRLAIVNVVMVGRAGAGDRGWVLIDAGIPGCAKHIRRAAEARFGPGARPAAILLTHGHFDHVGALRDLADDWDTFIYAHPDEHPFLDGSRNYPPPDPSVGGGLMALLSPLFPRAPINVSARLRALPEGGRVPAMPGWTWIATPGHAPGHVSFFRDTDRSLIVGDAFVTTAQESAYAVATQQPEIHGPPRYFTPDWSAAAESVRKLADLNPHLVITGHGRAMHGEPMRAALRTLATNFEAIAAPEQGKYAPPDAPRVT